MSKSSTSKTLVWILMAMLIFGLGGFGITNLGGSATSVGSVGDKEIDINNYAQRSRMRSAPLRHSLVSRSALPMLRP